MASNAKDKMLRNFLRRLGGTDTGRRATGSGLPKFPQGTQGADATFEYLRKRPPRRNWNTTGKIPGLGGVQEAQIARKIGEYTSRYDTTTRPRYGAQRAPYRPGEKFRRKNPYKYDRGDAARAHRPRPS